MAVKIATNVGYIHDFTPSLLLDYWLLDYWLLDYRLRLDQHLSCLTSLLLL